MLYLSVRYIGLDAQEGKQGRYIPLFASAVYDQNTLLVGKGLTPINLTSVIIGSYRSIRRCFTDTCLAQAMELPTPSRWQTHTTI